MAVVLTAIPSGRDIGALNASFERSLKAENKSPAPIYAYCGSVAAFTAYLYRQALPTALTAIRREHVEALVAALLATHKPATASHRYRGLQVFSDLQRGHRKPAQTRSARRDVE